MCQIARVVTGILWGRRWPSGGFATRELVWYHSINASLLVQIPLISVEIPSCLHQNHLGRLNKVREGAAAVVERGIWAGFNAKFIIVNAKFIICNAKSVVERGIRADKPIICSVQSSFVGIISIILSTKPGG